MTVDYDVSKKIPDISSLSESGDWDVRESQFSIYRSLL